MYLGKQQMYGQQYLYWVPWWLTWHSIKHVVQILLLSQHVACFWKGRWRMNSDVVFRKSSIYLLNLQNPFFLQNNKMTWIYAHTHTRIEGRNTDASSFNRNRKKVFIWKYQKVEGWVQRLLCFHIAECIPANLIYIKI